VTATMTGGQAVVQSLAAHGIRVLFGLPGVQNDWLYNALYDAAGQIRVIHTRHEQGAGYMALGYALATGDIGLCSVVPGPGVLNAGAALATAYALGARLFLLAGQIPLSQIGKGLGALHETPDQPGLLRSLTKLTSRIEHPAMAPFKVAEAIAHLKSGRPRPVAVEVPMDVLAQQAAVDLRTPSIEITEAPLDGDAIEAAARMIGEAKNPMIFVGGGAQGVASEVRELAEQLQAPVASYRTGRGVLDGRNPLSCMLPEARSLWKEVDVAIALGCSARTALQSWDFKDRKLVRIDVDPIVHGQFAQPAVAITARLEEALPALLSSLPRYNVARPSRATQMAEVHRAWVERSAVLQPQIDFLQAIRLALGEDGIFVDELTQVGFASRIVMPVYQPRTYISTGYMGTLGYGFPTALGAKVAFPNRRVLSITGDGGFLFGATELATAVQHKINLVTVLFNNGQYGNVMQMQRELYGGRIIASELLNPDFERFVGSFGAHYARATNARELANVLDSSFSQERPAVIEVPVGEMTSADQFR
jgi:acetolactate synthase I/II/III large subunit